MTDTIDSAAPEKLVVQCTACDGKFRLSAKHAGKTIKCPSCAAPMAIPPLDAVYSMVGSGAASANGYDAGNDDDDADSHPVESNVAEPSPQSVVEYNAGEDFGDSLVQARPISIGHMAVAEPVPAGNGYDSGNDDDDGDGYVPAPPPPAKSGNRADDANGGVVKVGGIKSGDPITGRNKEPKETNKRERSAVVRKDTNRRADDRRDAKGEGRGKTATIKRGETRAMTAPRKNQNLPMMIGTIAASVIGLVAVLAILMSGDGTSPDASGDGTANGGVNKGTPDAPPPDFNALTEENITRWIKDFDKAMGEAADLNTRMNTLAAHAEKMHRSPRLVDLFRPKFTESLAAAKAELKGRNYEPTREAEALARIGKWASDCAETDSAKGVFEDALKLDPTCRGALSGLGYRQYKKPDDKLAREWDLESLLIDLDPYQEKWLSPEEWETVMELQGRVIEAAQSTWDAWARDPFLRKAHTAQMNLKLNRYFSKFEFETIVVEPFVVLLTNGTAGGKGTVSEQRKIEREAQLRAVWAEWKRLIQRWDLKSVKSGDSVDNPQPFVWVSFASQAEYDAYLKDLQKNLPPGARAYYDPKIESVIFYESANASKEDMAVVIHETIHQLMDRFSDKPPTGYVNHAFTEGFPEYFAGFTQNGDDVKFFQFNHTGRMDEIRNMRTFFNGKLRPLQFQNDYADWVIWDVPMLMSTPNIVWVIYISRFYAAAMGNTAYARRPEIRQRLGEVLFHSSFYAYAWAFTYFMNTEYPREYERFARMLMNDNRTGEAQTWLEAFEIRPSQPLPDLAYFADVAKLNANRDRAFTMYQQQLDIMRRTPEIKRINDKFIRWLEDNFKPHRDMGTADLTGNGGNNNAGNNNGNGPSANNRIPQELRGPLVQAAAGAIRGDRNSQNSVGQILQRLVQAGITDAEINEVLGEHGMNFDRTTGQLTGQPR